jgi:hypothetical protein
MILEININERINADEGQFTFQLRWEAPKKKVCRIRANVLRQTITLLLSYFHIYKVKRKNKFCRRTRLKYCFPKL